MAAVLHRVASSQHPEFPATIFYAFKQQELKKEGLHGFNGMGDLSTGFGGRRTPSGLLLGR